MYYSYIICLHIVMWKIICGPCEKSLQKRYFGAPKIVLSTHAKKILQNFVCQQRMSNARLDIFLQIFKYFKILFFS
jgi:hypothetical protein